MQAIIISARVQLYVFQLTTKSNLCFLRNLASDNQIGNDLSNRTLNIKQWQIERKEFSLRIILSKTVAISMIMLCSLPSGLTNELSNYQF